MKRRDFLLGALATAPTAAVMGGASSLTRWDGVAYRKRHRSRVVVSRADSYESPLVERIVEGVRLCGVSVAGRSVLLKPNLVEFDPQGVVNTDPRVVAAAIEAFRRLDAREVTVAEGPGHRRDNEYLLRASGLQSVLDQHRARYVDLNSDDVSALSLPSRFTSLGRLYFPQTVLKADLVVSMPKLKTHHWAGVTLSMKNLFGVIPGSVYGWPKNILHMHGIARSILDLTATVRPQLTVVDAVTAMEGDGPIMGKPRPLGFIAMGADLPAVDATCARVIGLDPLKLAYLEPASHYLGNIDERRIDQRGESLARYITQFDLVPSLQYLRK